MGRPITQAQLAGALPAVNLGALVAAVAVLWWRAATVEAQVAGLAAAVQSLTVEVAQLTQARADRP